MNTEQHFEDSMKLPDGMHCSECRFHSYCVKLFECPPENTHCDWAPSRFSYNTNLMVNP